MAADRALAEDDEASREDVGAFDGDRHRDLHVRGAYEVRRPHADPLAPGDVHGVDGDPASAIGQVILGDRGEHRRLLAQVDHARDQPVGRIHGIQIAAHARKRFLDALELADRRLELAAHARVATGGTHDELGHAGRQGWE